MGTAQSWRSTMATPPTALDECSHCRTGRQPCLRRHSCTSSSKNSSMSPSTRSSSSPVSSWKAVRHGSSPIALIVWWTDETVRIEVTDGDPHTARVALRRIDRPDPGGRGLRISESSPVDGAFLRHLPASRCGEFRPGLDVHRVGARGTWCLEGTDKCRNLMAFRFARRDPPAPAPGRRVSPA